MPKLILIDGNSLAYRAFYALPDTMRTATGLTTNAVYGFTSMLLKVLDEQPDYLAIAFDRPEPTFRHQEYKEYKATRQKAPPTLREQFPYIKEIIKAFNIPVFELAGFEADDLIGTLAKKGELAGFDVVIMSGDLDPLQIVNDHIKVLTTRKGLTDTILYGTKEVVERYGGLKPNQLIDYKALKGDTSDNIPGVPKVGEKTAIELLQEFGTLEGIYNNLDKINKPALKENLKNNLPLAELSRRLGTIVTDAPITADFTLLAYKMPDWPKVLPVFEKYEFTSLIKKHIKVDAGSLVEKKRVEIAKFDFQLVQTETQLDQLITLLNQSQGFAFDLETTGLDPFEVEIVGLSFSTATKAAYYLPLKNSRAATLMPAEATLRKLQPLFLSDKLKIGHNLKYDIEVLRNNNISVAGPLFDTMVAAYILDPTAGKYSLKHLAKQFIGREMIKLGEIIDNEAEGGNFSQVPLEVAKDYACSDAEATFGLYEIFKLALTAQKLADLFYSIEMPLLSVLIEMELTGVKVDHRLLGEMSREMAEEIKDLERHLFTIAGEVFNLNSPKQLSHILFTKLQLPIIKRTKTGISTDVEVLEELAKQKFEIAEKLIDYRQLTKLKNTYIDVLPTLIKQKTGRIHSSFNQTITATGRLSSSAPNLQNIPVKGAWGQRIRAAFIPEEKDWLILSADYSQIELRVLAHLSGDLELIKAFAEAADVHQATADELGISRDAAKTVNFGVIYGISDFGLAKQLGIKRTEAAVYIDKYFKKFTGVKAFIDNTIKEAKEKGYIKTLLGRKRPLADINNPNNSLRQAAERTAINTPVQGTAADMIKIAMVNIFTALQTTGLQAKLLMQVHDEVVLECPEAEAKIVVKMVTQQMAEALKLKVPIIIDTKQGANWSQG